MVKDHEGEECNILRLILQSWIYTIIKFDFKEIFSVDMTSNNTSMLNVNQT